MTKSRLRPMLEAAREAGAQVKPGVAGFDTGL